MNLTLDHINRLTRRLHKYLGDLTPSATPARIEDIREIFAQSTGAASWGKLSTHLTHSKNTEDVLSLYSNETVRHAIANSLLAIDTEQGWSARAVKVIDMAYAVSPLAFRSIDGIREMITYDFLEQQQDVREVAEYFAYLPGYTIGAVSDARAQHGWVIVCIEHALANWEHLLHPETCAVPPPVTADILLRCIDQHVEWAPTWTTWFQKTHG